jgi:hypothetical protein
MRTKSLVTLVLAALLCAPLYAWRTSGDPDVLKEHYLTNVQKAMAEAQKCLTPEEGKQADVSKARFYLLAVCDLCVPSGGHDPKVPEDTIAAYKALCLKAWPEGQIPTEKDFDAAVKAYSEKLDGAYINAFYIADNADTYTVRTVSVEFAKGESKRDAALPVAIEFAGKSIPPEAFTKYFYGGKEGSEAVQLQGLLANLFGGPETIRMVCKEVFVPNAIEGAESEAKRAGPDEKDADMLRMRAKFVQEDYLDFLHWADPDNPKTKELDATVKEIRDRAAKITEAEIKANRVPPDAYTGADRDALKAAMKAAFKFEIPHTILRVVIPSTQWVEKAHVWTGYNAVDVGWYRLLDGAVVIKRTGDGTCWVHPVTFGRRWAGHGDEYGNLVVYGWADNYQILPANVNK